MTNFNYIKNFANFSHNNNNNDRNDDNDDDDDKNNVTSNNSYQLFIEVEVNSARYLPSHKVAR